MAHFAELDENNVVTRVIVVDNNDCCDEQGEENEEIGIEFCKSLFGETTIWKQTSYNTHGGIKHNPETNEPIDGSSGFRGNYAGIRYTYDGTLDAFLPPKPFPSWELDVLTYNWKPPFPSPKDGLLYVWDEQSLSWKEYQEKETGE